MRAFTADGQMVPLEEAAEMAERVFGTVFGWLPAFAQGADGSSRVVSESMSVKDGILTEGSPIYGEEEENSSKEESLRVALALARSFQGWTGAPIDYVSLKWWGFNQDTEGGDGILVRGYGEMVDWLKAEIERLGGVIQTNEQVVSVELQDEEEGEEGSVALTSNSSLQNDTLSVNMVRKYQAPYSLITLPLGVLKHSPPTFIPPLTIRRQQAIERLGMGLLDKIVLVYEKAWWSSSSPSESSSSAMANILIPSKDDPTRLFGPTGGLPPNDNGSPIKGSFPPRTPEYLKENPQALMVFDLHAQCGIPALCVFVPGEFGDVEEQCDEEKTTEWVTGVVGQWLGGLMNGAGKIPKPVEVLRTKWRKDQHAFGSYAYIPVGTKESTGDNAVAASPMDQLELSRTMWDRCFWAGEHTELDQYASVHGAWTTGVREAEKILIRLEGVDI